MDLEILMSTMNKQKIEDLKLKKKKINIEDKITIINQVNQNEFLNSFEKANPNWKMYSVVEKGLSKSRNYAIRKATSEICLIADDDVVYKEGYKKVIEEAYKKYPNADLITFEIETPEGKKFKKYTPKERHTLTSIMKVSSIEITFKRKKIEEKEIKYDESFGLGSKYKLGEENIFLTDCLKKGLKIYHYPKIIVIHPKETSCSNLDEENLFNKGAFLVRVFGRKCFFIGIGFILKKYIFRELTTNLLNSISAIIKGGLDYKKS